MSHNNDYRNDVIVLDDNNDKSNNYSNNNESLRIKQQVPSNTRTISSTIDEICIAQYEEQLLNYQKVFDTIQSLSSLQNDKENCNTSSTEMKKNTTRIISESIVAKSQLLYTIQNNYHITLNGTLPNKHNNTTTKLISIVKDKNDENNSNSNIVDKNELHTKRKLQSIQSLYDQTRKQLDIDTVTICNSKIYKNQLNNSIDDTIESICTDLSNSNLKITCLNSNNNNNIQNMTTDENDNDDDDYYSVDVDNFFDYHPHCIRDGWGHEIDDDDDEDSSSDSDESSDDNNNNRINNQKDYNSSKRSGKKKSMQQQNSTKHDQCSESSINNNTSTTTINKKNGNHNHESHKVLSGHSLHDPITILETAVPTAKIANATTTISTKNQYDNDNDPIRNHPLPPTSEVNRDDQGKHRNINNMNQNQGPVAIVNPYGRKNKDTSNNNNNNNSNNISHNNISSNDRNGINNDNNINCHQSYQSSMNNNNINNSNNNSMHENNSNTMNNQYGYIATGNTKSNSNSSTSEWDDHYRRQNPFQTAREYSWASSDTTTNNNNSNNNLVNSNNNNNSHDPNQQYRNSNENHHRQQQQYNNHTLNQNDSSNNNNNNFHRQASSENSQYNNYNSCQNDNIYNPYRSKQFEDKSGLNPPPPSAIIRDSLKRKFQLPKVGKNTTDSNARAGNTSSGSSTNGDNKLPPKNKNSTNTTTSYKSDNNNHSKKVDDNNNNNNNKDDNDTTDDLPECLKRYGKDLVEKIENEIMECGDKISFNDIAGLADQKQTVLEVVCWPMKRPDLFTGLRSAPNGLLLYGPPGTGKTLIGKAIAHESGATFFSISSSSLTSKWIGEGEKLVRTLFAVAAYREPAVVFIDEIDSLLTQRKADENEASRRIKTEFLCQLDGTGTSSQGRVLLIGATNRPQELDDAARRRFTKRLYIPLPERTDREMLLRVLLDKNRHQLDENEIKRLADDTEGYSGADIKALSTEAAMGPIRQLGSRALEVNVIDVPPIIYKHFRQALRSVRPSVSPSDLHQYIEWDKTYGSRRTDEDDDEDDDDDIVDVS